MNLANKSGTSRDIYDWDYVLWEVRLTLLAAGFFIYLGVFLLAHWLSSWISASYRALPGKEKAFWNMHMTRGVFAVQSCGAGLWAWFIDPVFQADQVYSQQKWSYFHCLIAAGYFLLDNVLLHVSNILFGMFEKYSVVHHLFAFGAILVVITNIKSGHYLILTGLLLEMSSPSTCLSHVLSKIGYDNTRFWKANQWVLIRMCHCRIVLSYHMLWVCISNWNDVVENMGLPYFIVFFMGLSIFTFIINPHWTYETTEKFFRQVDGNSSNTAVKNESSETVQKKMI
ncbi:protein CLN8-like [Emys orbicularis]|uniref:protein CLN8-like n=1 Tax=Emys orbicularis TaxID=82168 RepID=UPI0031FDA460